MPYDRHQDTIDTRESIYNSQRYHYYKGLEDAVYEISKLQKSYREPTRWLSKAELAEEDLLIRIKFRLIDKIKTYPWVHQMIERTICSKS